MFLHFLYGFVVRKCDTIPVRVEYTIDHDFKWIQGFKSKGVTSPRGLETDRTRFVASCQGVGGKGDDCHVRSYEL